MLFAEGAATGQRRAKSIGAHSRADEGERQRKGEPLRVVGAKCCVQKSSEQTSCATAASVKESRAVEPLFSVCFLLAVWESSTTVETAARGRAFVIALPGGHESFQRGLKRNHRGAARGRRCAAGGHVFAIQGGSLSKPTQHFISADVEVAALGCQIGTPDRSVPQSASSACLPDFSQCPKGWAKEGSLISIPCACVPWARTKFRSSLWRFIVRRQQLLWRSSLS